MTWHWVSAVNAWVADVGTYTPGDSRPRCPHHSLFSGDLNEIDYAVVLSTASASTFTWTQARYDSYTYKFDDSGTTGWSADPSYFASSVTDTSYKLFVVAYTDGGSGSTPLSTAEDLTPSAYATAGTATNPTPPANDDFANRTALASTLNGTVSLPANMEWASLETDEVSSGQYPWDGNTVWREWVPPVSGDYAFTVDTLASPSRVRGWAYAYRASSLSPGQHPTAIPHTWGQSSGVLHITGAVAGETIYLQLDMANHYDATWTWIGPAPDNDDYANRQTIDFTDGLLHAVSFSLVNATLESGEQHTSGMAGSVWYETVPLAADNWVLFEVPAGVEVVLFRGTATLAGMLYRSTSNDAARTAFFLGTGYTYFVKLQSATATESGTLNVRPFAWTDWITPAPIQRGSSGTTNLFQQHSTTTTASLHGAWDEALADTPTPTQFSNRLSVPYSPVAYTEGYSVVRNGSGSVSVGLDSVVFVEDFIGSPSSPLSTGNYPTDPVEFDPTRLFDYDYATDPVSGDVLQFDTGTASIAAGMGTLSFGAITGTPGGSDPGSHAPEDRDLDYFLNPVTPPSPSTAAPSPGATATRP